VNHQHHLIKKTVQAILESPHSHHWTVQGLGMLRTYLDKGTRLHIWCDHLRTPNVSEFHTHPWHLRSYVVAGVIEDVSLTRQSTSGEHVDMIEQRLKCGAGACLLDDPEQVRLWRLPTLTIGEGAGYWHMKQDIHTSRPADGTVTLVTRTFDGNEDEASVFWPVGEQWVTAEPRPATGLEVMRATRIALHKGFRPNVNMAHVARHPDICRAAGGAA
jgi:hypothetical protein